MNFTPWTLVVDAGIVSLLLMLGKLLRAKVRFLQKLFIPPSLLAGFFGLIFGPELLGWLPLSNNLGTYASILIALVFSTLPMTSQKRAKGSQDVGRMWVYSQTGQLLQWGLGGALGLWVISLIWPVNPAFGLAMPAGYSGGHGTAAAIGQAFAGYGVEEMQTLAMTAATVGIIAAVVLGMWRINRAAHNGDAAYLTEFSELPDEYRTGIVPKEKRKSMGEASFSSISLDSLTFNTAVVCFIALLGYGISKLVSLAWPALTLPVFSCAFIAGLLVRRIFDKTKLSEFTSRDMINHLGGGFTDYLVAFGVSSIKLKIVVEFAVPLAILLASGLILTWIYVFVAGRRIHKTDWFEKSVFTWGWFTGTMAMSMALLRIADPDSKSGTLDDYAYAYIFIAPVEIALVTFAPVAFCNGLGWLFTGICLAGGLTIMAIAAARGYFKK